MWKPKSPDFIRPAPVLSNPHEKKTFILISVITRQLLSPPLSTSVQTRPRFKRSFRKNLILNKLLWLYVCTRPILKHKQAGPGFLFYGKKELDNKSFRFVVFLQWLQWSHADISANQLVWSEFTCGVCFGKLKEQSIFVWTWVEEGVSEDLL